MKKVRFLALAVLLGFSALAAAPAMAEHGSSRQCPMHKDCMKGDCGGSKDCDGGYECPITEKIIKKAGFFLKNKAEIGLSDEQVAQIKAIKFDTKKGYIRTMAEMQIFKMDLKEKLSDPNLDVEALNASLDKSAADWAAGIKAGVATYVKLKAVLDEAQMAKAKAIWMAKEDK